MDDPQTAPAAVDTGQSNKPTGGGKAPPKPPTDGKHLSQVEPIYVFLFGIFAIIAGLVISLIMQDPRPFPKTITTVFISLGGACLASGIAGFLEVESKWVRAGGPLGVLVFLCFFISQQTASGAGVNTGSAPPEIAQQKK